MTPSRRGQVDEAQRVADRHTADVQLDPVGNLHRQRLDVDLAVTWESTPPSLRPAASPTSSTDDLRLDRLVEADFLQVDVR